MTEAPGLASRLADAVKLVESRTELRPTLGLVLGSGLGAFARTLDAATAIPFRDIPHFPTSSVSGHQGELVLGRSGGVSVAVLAGRAHYYEGHPLERVVFPVRLLGRLGIKVLVVTNAAGSVNTGFRPGDLMIIEDHINLIGNPLVGPNEDALGTRFPDMTNAYDPVLREQLREVSKAEGLPLREGVYAVLSGPSYETPAEIRMLRILGAQAVGMSTVPEVIALRHMRVRCAALSCITNMAAGLGAGELDHKEVEETAKTRRADLQRLLKGWIVKAGSS